MNYAGTPLLSRPTISSGRGLFVIALTVVLSKYLSVDVSGLTVLGVTIAEDALGVALAWALGALWVSHLMHWVGDCLSLGKWNSSMSSKLAESTHGGGGKMKGRIEYVIERFEGALSEEEKRKDADIAYVKRMLEAIEKDCWKFERFAFFYVVVWSFLVPTLLAFWAIYLLCYG